MMLLNFLNSYTIFFFLECSSSGWEGTELGKKLFSLFINISRSGLARNKAKMMGFFFEIFLLFFRKTVGRNDTRNEFFFFFNFFGNAHPGWVETVLSTKIFLPLF